MTTISIADIPLLATDAASCRPVEGNLAELAHPLLKLLSDYNRLKIFALLAQGERCVCDIEQEVNLAQNLVSHHLRVLREAKLIQSRRDSRWVYYSVNTAELATVYPALCALFNPACISQSKAAC